MGRLNTSQMTLFRSKRTSNRRRRRQLTFAYSEKISHKLTTYLTHFLRTYRTSCSSKQLGCKLLRSYIRFAYCRWSSSGQPHRTDLHFALRSANSVHSRNVYWKMMRVKWLFYLTAIFYPSILPQLDEPKKIAYSTCVANNRVSFCVVRAEM